MWSHWEAGNQRQSTHLGGASPDSVHTMLDTDKETVLKEVEAEEDLGEVIDNRLCLKQHRSQATAKVNRILGIIRRSFSHLSQTMFVQLYKSLVRPILE